MVRRWAWRVFPAILGACGVDLTYPAGARILCISDDDCQGASKCSEAAGVCIAADDPDVAPRVSATATDSTHVVLLFSTSMQTDTLGRLASYTISPDIGVLAVDIASDGTRATLTTTQQRGRPYQVSAPALVDTLGRGLAPTSATFDGLGIPVDQTPPVLLLPPDTTRLIARDVTFTWRRDARRRGQWAARALPRR